MLQISNYRFGKCYFVPAIKKFSLKSFIKELVGFEWLI